MFTLAVTTTPKAWARNLELTRDTRHVRAALGLHPQLVSSRADEIALWEALLPQARYVGEVGLDAGPRFYRSLDLQKSVFTRVLQACAKAGGKIITVHSVRAVKAVLDHIEEHLPQRTNRVVLHWFTGSKSEATRALEMGCYFSINNTMLNSEKASTLIRDLPVERMLTETDGPFTEVDGRPSRPTDVASTVPALAGLLGLPGDALAKTMKDNLRRLLQETDVPAL
ncbi:MAG: Qat anti-phage system TatD family nuclease QatD [Bordetella sp.]|nr:Qat anti-phage system TatD family nuclease QatD [Bordetella sp.]